ncbi:hypothetical protein HY406_00690 [Candidatus Giovannonibacteria bacterium]|nr:hypothetical protein [Candidatus Giovannonibacteria bacterium]
MRHIKGYVCIGKFVREELPCREVLYGKSTSNPGKVFQNFQSNNLEPFKTKKEALRSKKALERLGFSDMERVSLGFVQMEVAETEAECLQLEGKKNLVVLKKERWTKEEWDIQLIGRGVEGKPGIYPLIGAFLFDNGFKPFLNFDGAIYAAREVARQAQCPAALATFQLKRL